MIWATWSGRGWVVPGIYLAVGLGFVALGSALGVERGSPDAESFANAGYFLAAVPLLYLGARWKRREGRLVWDARRKRLAHLPSGHTFFWLDVQVWGWILLAAGAAKLVGLT